MPQSARIHFSHGAGRLSRTELSVYKKGDSCENADSVFTAGGVRRHFPPAEDSASLSGKWQVHNSISGNESDQECTFIQKDDSLKGNCTSETGSVEINGKISGKKVSWMYKSEYNGTPLTVNYDGVVDSGKISGTVVVPEFGAEGDFTATQSR